MKNYQKPQATVISVTNSNTIASGLADWMEQDNVGLENHNITTYEMNS